jgi:hypothetical protein
VVDGTPKNTALQQRWSGSALKEALVARNAFVVELKRRLGVNSRRPV